MVPLVNWLKPRFFCATSIALHTVGVSTDCSNLKSVSVMFVLPSRILSNDYKKNDEI
ncbi:MAG: Uncharacterised protein [SAR116 cluster bacterium]|nr:MAG: Uncharacterised protein [SAR116 cluster bacterium]